MNKKLIIAKVLQKLGIEKEESKRIYEVLKEIPRGEKRDKELQEIVERKKMNKEDIDVLMYDLERIPQPINIKKPKPFTEPEFKDFWNMGGKYKGVHNLEETGSKVVIDWDFDKFGIHYNFVGNQFNKKITKEDVKKHLPELEKELPRIIKHSITHDGFDLNTKYIDYTYKSHEIIKTAVQESEDGKGNKEYLPAAEVVIWCDYEPTTEFYQMYGEDFDWDHLDSKDYKFNYIG